MRFFLPVLLFGVILVVFSAPALAQMPQPPAPPNRSIDEAAKDPSRVEIEKQMVKQANQQRQAQLKRDTENLVKLTAQLKEYVDKSSENTLSLEVMKKAEQIEKLARSVREKMKGY